MKKIVRMISLQLVVVSCLMVMALPNKVNAQTIPSNYVDNSPLSNITLNRYYSVGYLNAPSNSATPSLYSLNKYDVSGVADNPASGIASTDFVDLNRKGFGYMGVSLANLSVQGNRNITKGVVAFRTNDNFSFHLIVDVKSSGTPPAIPQSPVYNFYTGQLFSWTDRQPANDSRITGGFGARLGDYSKWSIGLNINHYTSNVLTGTFNLNVYDRAEANTLDIATVYNNQDEDGNGLTGGVRFKNISFLNSISTLKYNPGTTAQYENLYGMTRYIPAYLAWGAGYRYQLKEDQQLAIAGEMGLEFNHSIPDVTNASAIQKYETMGAFSNMSHINNVMGTASITYLKRMDDWSMSGQGGYIQDPYNKSPYLNVDAGYGRVHFGVGYFFTKSEYATSQLRFIFKTSL